MLRFQHEGKTVIWLDHQTLINEAYKLQITPSKIGYGLNSLLFNFKPKASIDKAGVQITVTTSKSKERRKRKAETSNCNGLENEENVQLKHLSDGFLVKLLGKGLFQSLENNNQDFQRVWEESHDFPQMKGANETLEFHHYTNNGYKYIIPPHCRFFNHDVLCLDDIEQHLEAYDFIVIDPPWRNKYVRRMKRFKIELGYGMVDNTSLEKIPIFKLIHKNSLIAVWCTNSRLHKSDLLQKIFPAWNLQLLKSIVWLKVNSAGKLIGELKPIGGKQPYEMLYIACHKESRKDFSRVKEMDYFISIPSIVHSHKPPLLEVFREDLPLNPKCLELFARYLYPEFTSIGLEVLKLMDERLYEVC